MYFLSLISILPLVQFLVWLGKIHRRTVFLHAYKAKALLIILATRLFTRVLTSRLPNHSSSSRFRPITRLHMTSTSSSCSIQPGSTLTGPIQVSYCTDVEGNYDYWIRYVTLSKVLGGVPGSGKLFLKDVPNVTTHFVFGGDACDRGCGDLRVMRDLVFLKRKYHDRVHLIIGNRDANKMRLFFELRAEFLTQPPSVYWLGDKDKVGWSAPDAATPEVHTMSQRLQWVSFTLISTIAKTFQNIFNPPPPTHTINTTNKHARF